MGPYITETLLREKYSLGYGTEIRLPADARLTPAAQGLLDDRKIIIKYVDEDGRVFLDQTPAAETVEDKHEMKQVNPLTNDSEWHVGTCLMCHQEVREKPEVLTNIDSRNLILKNDPRLKLRGKLDTVIALAVLIQTEFDGLPKLSQVTLWLSDVRSALGNVLKAEATGSEMPPVTLGDMSEEVLHAISHNPLKYLGHDHLLPEASQGVQVARLNLLRAEIREAELYAADVYIARDLTITRPDIMEGLNRLSSAVYVLMLLTYMIQQGKHISLKGLK